MNDDLISRSALREDFKARLVHCNEWITKAKDKETKIRASAVKTFIGEVIMTIDNAPTIDTTFKEVVAYECGQKSVEERPKGKWRSVGFEKGYAFCICSNCGNTTRLYRDSKNEFCCIADIRNKVIACLYCGAEMRSVDEGLHARAISDLSKAVDDAYKKARGDV